MAPDRRRHTAAVEKEEALQRKGYVVYRGANPEGGIWVRKIGAPPAVDPMALTLNAVSHIME